MQYTPLSGGGMVNAQPVQNPYGVGGSQYASRSSDAQTWAWQALYDQLGRAPTPQELAQAAPAFMGADPNIMNVQGGNAFVSQMAKAIQAQSPDQSQQTANTAANQENQNVMAQLQQLMPTLQQSLVDPINQAINQQGQNQQNLQNNAISGIQGLTGQGANTIQNLMNQGIGQQQGFNKTALDQSSGLNQQAMGNQQGINQQGVNQAQNLLGQGMGMQQGINRQNLGQAQGLLGEGLGIQQGINSQAFGNQQGINQQALGQQQGLNQQSMQGQQGINSDLMNQLKGIDTSQTGILQQLMGNQTSDLMRQLTDPSSGSMGQQMQNYYNKLGLLNSGAFNEGLATQFGNLAGQQSQEILQNQINQQTGLQNAANTGAGDLSGLQSQGAGALASLTGQGAGAMGSLNSQGSTALTGAASQGLGNIAGVQNQGAHNLTNMGTLGLGNIANTQSQGMGSLSGLNSQGLSNQQGVSNQGNAALTNILGQGMQDTANTYGSGLNSMLGIANQGYGTQSGLGMTGLNTQMQADQMPINLGLQQAQSQQSQGNALQNLLTQQGFNINDFNQQSTLGQLLANQSAPSTLQKDIGMASGAAQGVGALAQAAGPASTMTSYVCMELIKRGLLCQMDMDDFHVRIMPAMFKRARAFWKYAMDGKRLVDAVNAKGLDWKVFKPLLFDRVMEEPDPCKAVDLYADACHQLCISSDRTLWDERVYRNSVLDTFLFLPRLLFYKPFMDALWKTFRIKTAIIYDRPRCGHAL